MGTLATAAAGARLLTADDRLLVSWPGSGATWLRRLLTVVGGAGAEAEAFSPELESLGPPTRTNQARVVATHRPLGEWLPHLRTLRPVVALVRDPVELAWRSGDVDGFLRDWPPFADGLLAHLPSLRAIVTYDQLARDTFGTLARTARLLDLPVDAAALDRAVAEHPVDLRGDRDLDAGRHHLPVYDQARILASCRRRHEALRAAAGDRF